MTVGGAAVGRREEAGIPVPLRGLVSRLMIVGLAIACVFFLLGVAAYLDEGVGPGGTLPADGQTGSFASALLQGQPGAFITVGLMVLLATPVARVVLSAALFASVGDRPFTALTVFVLTVLVATVLIGVVR